MTPYQSGLPESTAKLHRTARTPAETTKQAAKTKPSGQRVDPLQVFVKSAPNSTLLNQDPIFGNPRK